MAYIQRIMGRKLPIMVILDQNIKTQNINDRIKNFQVWDVRENFISTFFLFLYYYKFELGLRFRTQS